MSAHILEIGGRSYPLKWGPGARYRAEGLPEPLGLSDLRGKRATRAAFAVAWAMLPPGSPFASPEALVDAVDAEAGAFDRMDAALAGAILNAYPEAGAKKASTGSSPAPESSSVSACPGQKSKPSIKASGTHSKSPLRERN
jgi:hypothetical protein